MDSVIFNPYVRNTIARIVRLVSLIERSSVKGYQYYKSQRRLLSYYLAALQNTITMPLPFTKAIFKKLLQPEREESGEPNFFHLTLGQEGYRFQSRVFRIQSRFGAFSRGPRELQAYEGSQFALLLYQLILWVIYGIPLLAIGNFAGVWHLDLRYATFRAVAAMAANYWIGMVLDPRRRPANFHAVWKADGWRQTALEDRLRQTKLRAWGLHLRLERNELEWEKLQLERSYRLALRSEIEEEVFERDEEDITADMVDMVDSFIDDWSS